MIATYQPRLVTAVSGIDSSRSSALAVWSFPTEGGAQRCLGPLSGWLTRGLELDDAAVVSWPSQSRRPSAWQVNDVGGPGKLAGAFWGMLIGLVFLLPLTRAASQADADAVARDHDSPPSSRSDEHAHFADLGLTGAFVGAVRSQVVAGTSALFLVDSSTDPMVASRALNARAVEVARVDLSAAQVREWRAAFGD